MGKEDAELAMRILCDLIVEDLMPQEKAERARAVMVRTLYQLRIDRGEIPAPGSEATGAV